MAVLRYDLFVIGTGEAGTTAAIMASKAGWKTAIADNCNVLFFTCHKTRSNS